MTRRHLNASAHTVANLHAAAMTVDSVEGRYISGTLVPYGPVGMTTIGPVVVPGPGRLEFPAGDMLRRVKLVDEHQDPPRSVGYAVAMRDTADGLRAQFYISPTPDGDRVLAEMTPDENGGRARDGFSVELVDIQLRDGLAASELVRGRVNLVAAVVSPAWADAREDGLAASQSTTEGSPHMLTEAQRARLAELLAIAPDDRTTDQATEVAELLTLAGGDPEETPEETDETPEETEETPAQLAAGRRRAARVPNTGAGNRRRAGRPITELYASMSRVLSGVSRPELEAALADITGTANIWTARDDYAGQLWDGLSYTRRYVPLMMPGPLPSYKGTGWKWVTKPEVDDYAGDKAAVPSNEVETAATSWTAARLAGAHDIDRKFFDFEDSEFIAAYYEALTEDYAVKSDAKARAFILANAVAAGAAGLTIWNASAKAAQSVFDATGGRAVDYLLVNSADVLDLVNVPQAEAADPKILEMFGVSLDKFIPTAGVAAGTVVAGIKEATRFRELSSTPIRVEAINVANGGIDGGVFGYYATEETFEGGIASATFDATP